MKSETKLKIKNYLLLLLQTIVCGIIIGLVVGLYQLAISLMVNISKFMYGNEMIVLVLVMVAIGIGLAFINDLLIKFAPGIDGSGIPNIELGIRGKKKIDWKKEIVLMFVNSCISTLAGFPLGSEGPSVVMGGKISKMTQDITKIEDNDSIAIACGTGFGCAFLSPLAGLCYIFEESLHKFNPSLLFRALLMMLSAYFTSSLINHHHILNVVNAEMPGIHEYYVFIILMIINAFVGIGFVKLIVWLKELFTVHKDNIIIKNRGFILFGLVIILNVFLLELMGSGSGLVENIAQYEIIWVVLLILLFRFVITCLSGAGKVTGGLVVPMMVLGALTGQLVFLACNQVFGLNSELQPIIVLVSMVMIFGVITKTPITSIALIYSTIGYCTGDYLHSLIIIPIAAVTIFGSFYISKLFKVDCLYELFMEVSLRDEERKKIEVVSE